MPFAHLRWSLLAMLTLWSSVALAQTPTLEFTTAAPVSGTNPNTNGSGPTTAAQVITFLNNTNNPTGTIFATYTPTTTATFVLGRQQYPLSTAKSSTGYSVNFGGTANSSAVALGSSALFPAMSALGSAPATSFTSASTVTASTGIDVAVNNAVRIQCSTEALDYSVTAANVRPYMADLTISFSAPIVNPVIHVVGLGSGLSGPNTGNTTPFTTELELQTLGVTLSKLSGSTELNVTTDNKILNSATTLGPTTGSGAASGSVLATTSAAGVTSLTFKVYLRSTVGGFWQNASPSTSHSGDGWLIAVSSLATAPQSAPADILQTTLSGPATTTVNQPITYTAITTNVSTVSTVATPSITLPTGATGVILPAGATLAGNVVTFAAAPLDAGQSLSNSVSYVPAATGSVTAKGSSTSSVAETTLTNNNGSAANAIVTTIIGAAAVAACASPGAVASPASIAGVVNTYYPGVSAVANAGNTASLITVGATGTSGSSTGIAAGDLLLVIQMQGTDLTTTNNNTYGSGLGTGSGNQTTNFTAGTYEYVVANSALAAGAAGTITTKTLLVNSYSSSAATASASRRSFQVVRIPQYGNATLSGTLSAQAWDGLKGGILALDVAGTLTLGGQKLDAAGLGFRGGAGFKYTGTGTGVNSDYRTPYSTPVNATKGEGLAGTPRSTATYTGSAFTVTNNSGVSSAFSTTTLDGYPSGDNGRGAPGNAGGGGTDGDATGNGFNSGGAGGGNGGTGGLGGYPRISTANGSSYLTTTQAVGGAVFAAVRVSRLVMGGGGGAGSNNDGQGTASGTDGSFSSGAAGGGIILVRVGSFSGTGTADASGAGGITIPTTLAGVNDGVGGGGAGGSVLLTARLPATLNTLTVLATGGNGNSNSNTSDVPHGPGGGGGGGFIFANGTPKAGSSVAGGVAGTTNASATAVAPFAGKTNFGATDGTAGTVVTSINQAISGSTAGASCNDIPVAFNNSYTIPFGTTSLVLDGSTASTTKITASATDAIGGVDQASVDLDPFTAGIQQGPVTVTGGSFSVSSAGVVTFTPTAGFVGTATLPYVLSDIYGAVSNQAIIRVTVAAPISDLSTTITAPVAGASSAAGALVAYTVTAKNNTGTGYSDAPGVVETIQLQPGLNATTLTVSGSTSTSTAGNIITYAGGTYAGATYNTATGMLTFPPVSLALGATQTYSFSAAAPAADPYTVTASVGNGNPDPTPANNTASTTLRVTPAYNVGTSITGPVVAGSSQPTVGDALSYVVTATNAGTTPALGAVQLVTIGQGRTQVHATGSGYYNGTAAAVTGDFVNGVFVLSGTGSQSVPAGTVIFPPVNLTAAQTVNNTITFAAPATSTGAITSTFSPATLANDTGNTGLGVNSATVAAVSTVAPAAGDPITNLRTTLTATTDGTTSVASGTVAANTAIIYTATLVNDGPTAAANAQLTLSLPANLTPVFAGSTASAPAANGDITYTGTYVGTVYNQNTGVLTFPGAGTLTAPGPGNTKSYAFTLTVPATIPVINVMALASTTTLENSMDDNVAQVSTNVAPAATDVSVVLTGPATATAAQPVTYTVTTTNNGTPPAVNVRQIVALPIGLAISTTGDAGLRLNGSLPINVSNGVATFSDNSTYNSASGVLTLAAVAVLPAQQVAQNTVTYPAPAVASFANSAVVATSSVDSNPNNNSSALTTTLTASDIAVAVSGPASATVGNTLTYVVTTTNNGLAAATSATTTTAQLLTGLPTSTTGATVRINGAVPTSVDANNVATYANGATYDPRTGVATFAGIAYQAVGTIGSVVNTVSFEAPDASRLNVTATASPAAATGDTNPSNNTAEVATTLTAPSGATVDLQVGVGNNGPVAPGAALTFTVTPQNLSTTTAATNVRLQVVVASGLSITIGDPNVVQVSNAGNTSNPIASVAGGIATYQDGSTYDANTGRVTFSLATPNTLAASTTGTARTVTFPAPSTGTVTAVASVRSADFESNPLNNVATSVATVSASVDLATAVSGPARTAAGTAVVYTVSTTNNQLAAGAGSATATQTITVPAGVATATPTVGGPGTVAVSGSPAAGYTITISGLTVGAGATVVNTVSFSTAAAATLPASYAVGSTVSATGATDAVAANNNGAQTTLVLPTGPLADDIVNSGRTGNGVTYVAPPIGNTAGQVAISSLAATPGSTPIASYTITALPSVGRLYYLVGSTVTAAAVGVVLDLTMAGTLLYDPADAGPQGTTTPSTLDASNQYFTFFATDRTGLTSNPALYTIRVNQDAPTVYTVNTPKPATVVYSNGDEVARAFDYNGGRAITTDIFTPDPITATAATSNGRPANMPSNGLSSAVANTVTNVTTGAATTLAAVGLQINATTGQITVLDKTLLRAGTYRVNVTTVDNYGGVTTQNVTFNIGAAGVGPLPVTLTTFTAQAVHNQDGLLKWTTASETDNAYFDVERSLDGSSFVKIGQVAGQGTKLTATDYTLLDAGVAAKATGLVYYRLRQVDLSGAAAYSVVRTISFGDGSATLVSVYPNPAASATTLDLRSLPAASTYQVQLLDATGRTARTWTLGGNQLQALELSNVAAGTYHVLVTGLQPDGSVLRQLLRLTKE